MRRANWLALAVPGALLLGALGSQYIGGLHPCEMCYWQRWPHLAAVALAAVAFFAAPRLRFALIALAALAVIVSGAIGVFHAGVEYHWWQGLTTCASSGGQMTLDDIIRAPIIRCDAAQWTLFGVSLAGYNALASFAGALAILWALRRAR